MSKGFRVGIALAVACVAGFLFALTTAPLWVGLLVCGVLAFVGVPFIQIDSWKRRP